MLCFANRRLMSFSWCDFHYSYFQSAWIGISYLVRGFLFFQSLTRFLYGLKRRIHHFVESFQGLGHHDLEKSRRGRQTTMIPPFEQEVLDLSQVLRPFHGAQDLHRPDQTWFQEWYYDLEILLTGLIYRSWPLQETSHRAVLCSY